MSEDDKKSGSNPSKSKGARQGGGVANVQWFNPKPTATDVEWLATNDSTLLERVLILFEGLPERQRISIKYNAASTRWLAILFIDVHTKGIGIQALSVRGATPLDALALLEYFHNVKFAGGWAEDEPTVSGKYG